MISAFMEPHNSASCWFFPSSAQNGFDDPVATLWSVESYERSFVHSPQNKMATSAESSDPYVTVEIGDRIDDGRELHVEN